MKDVCLWLVHLFNHNIQANVLEKIICSELNFNFLEYGDVFQKRDRQVNQKMNLTKNEESISI